MKEILRKMRIGPPVIIVVLIVCLTGCPPATTIPEDEIETVAAPSFSPIGGIYGADQDVSISCTTDGATIYYTTDGSEPTLTSPVYASTIPVHGHSTSLTIKAMAARTGMENSGQAEATYAISYPGSAGNPILISSDSFTDTRDTSTGGFDDFNTYPPDARDMSGRGFLYMFTIANPMTLNAAVTEDAGADIDIYLLSSIDPVTFKARNTLSLNQYLEAGTYYLSLDTYVSSGVPQSGPYTLNVTLTP
jgi:hypothetical protein